MKAGGKLKMSLKPSVEEDRQMWRSMGLTAKVAGFPESTRTAAEAPAASGTTMGQIAKFLVFVAGAEPFLVLVSGANWMDMEKMNRLSASRSLSRMRKLSGESPDFPWEVFHRCETA
jgi:prolyl-tRNA editing enzyme YbaK/EbsC (Cys-tRNA(Pro) deacylase)